MMWKYAYPKPEEKVRQDVREEAMDKLDREESVAASKGGVDMHERAVDDRA